MEAYHIVRENNKAGREKQKEQYDKGTKLIVFQPGEMIYLHEMIKGKGGCPKFRIRWRGPYEVIRRLSDLNYLVRVTRNKEIVVNVNKMKKYFRKTAETPSALAQSDAKGQDGMNDDDVTSSAVYDYFETAHDSRPEPPAMTEETMKEQRHDPTWEPSRHHEIQMRPDATPEIRKEIGDRYWLRSRERENQVASDEIPLDEERKIPDAEVNEGDKESEEASSTPFQAEPSTSTPLEEGKLPVSEGDNTSASRYNLRPCPGRKI
jgi:hypothetical protein